jgi:L-threonylcarbamoyladenylate synthase
MTSSTGLSKVIHLPSSQVAIDQAVDVLLSGHLVAFPTETVYGLGADAENPEAVERIYQAKGRPSNHPVIVHVAPEADLSYWVAALPWQAQRLIDQFWPGPLTLILKRAAHIPQQVSGGQDSIGLRCPSHPIAIELLRAFARGKPSGQGGIAAPSANKFGHVSPTHASHVREEFPEQLAEGMPVLEGGASEVGIESTIIDLSRVDSGLGPVLLRPGFISAEQIEDVLGQAVLEPDGEAPRVSGALKSHYAPNTPLALASMAELTLLAQQLSPHDFSQRIALVAHSKPVNSMTENPQVDWIAASTDPVIYAHDLYMQLRALDKGGYARIVFEQVPDTPKWLAVRDRLSRAAADKNIIEDSEDSQE